MLQKTLRKESMMERLMPDSVTLVALVLAVVVAACVAILVALRDRRFTRERLVTHALRCPHRDEPAVVTFVERMRTGLTFRRVESCSLLDTGERCSGTCTAYAAMFDERPAPKA